MNLRGLVTRPNFVGPCYLLLAPRGGRGFKSIWQHRKTSMVKISQSELPGQALLGTSPSILPTNSIQLASPAKARLSLISRHLGKPDLALNTPFSIEGVGPIDLAPPSPVPVKSTLNQTDPMSTQANHPTLLIPGPVEFDYEVLQSMAHYRCVNQSFKTSDCQYTPYIITPRPVIMIG
jgi:hypothetical protein